MKRTLSMNLAKVRLHIARSKRIENIKSNHIPCLCPHEGKHWANTRSHTVLWH